MNFVCTIEHKNINHMRKTYIPVIAILLCISTGCSQKHAQVPLIKSVKIDTAQLYNRAEELTFPGKVEAGKDINIAFKVAGTIEEIPVNQGDFVKKGDIIAIMDPRDYQTQLNATTAEYNAIKGQAERVISLYQDSSVAENDYEKAMYGLQQITAKLKAHQDALNDTKLRAPFDGYIQKIIFDKNETVGAGMAVISMIGNSPNQVTINIPIKSYTQRDNFDSYSCTFDIMPNRVFPLELIGVSPKANMNQLYNVKLQFKESDKNITPGMSTNVTITQRHESEERLQIPLSAIFNKEGATYVMIYNPTSSTVETRKVNIDSIDRNSMVLITNGLNEGDIVVSAGVNSLKDGEKVTPLKENSSTNIGGLL